MAGSTVCGLLGSIWPAIQVARVSPLSALSVRAKLASARVVRGLLVAGIVGVAFHLALFTLVKDAQVIFWTYVTFALPLYMVGYFCLGPATTLLVARVLGGPISSLLRLPPGILRRSVQATPYRFGFTSGAMMAGLALLVAIWTQGGAALRDWIAQLRFPDAFVVGIAMDQRTVDELRKLDFVLDTSPVSLHPVTTEVFGVRGFTSIKTFFVAFEPESFFRMTALEWIQGEPEAAKARLAQGGAVIVSREFLTASNVGVGGTWTCTDDDGNPHSFEIVGVVGSPGLEIVSNFFDVGEDFTEARVHSVFGSQKDLNEKFGVDSIGMIQIDLSDTVADEEALTIIREKLLPAGILSAGSGRAIKSEIVKFADTALVVSSSVAIFAMSVACLGVANLIIAGVQSRRFEFGVLRAVGASRGLLTRLVLAEALVVAITACALGSVMGVQGAFGGTRLNTLIWGLNLELRPPPFAIAIGCVGVVVMTLLAAGPAAILLGRQRVRELLGAMKG
jgi:putative ABC transport system permease protein